MQDASNDRTLPAGSYVEISTYDGEELRCSRTYVVLSSYGMSVSTMMRDGALFQMLVLSPEGAIHDIILHENEIRGGTWYSSRRVTIT